MALSEPMPVFAALCAVAVTVYLASGIEKLKPVFRVVPPVVWLYFTPMFLGAAQVLPHSSVVYDWMAKYLLPAALFLITLSVSLPALAKLGRMTVTMLLIGTLGTALGAIVSLAGLTFLLPPDAWQSLSMLSASWIGGSANMLAIQQSLQADAALLGPIVVVDAFVGYGWLGVLIWLSAYQSKLDQWLRADRSTLNAVGAELAESAGKPKIVSTRYIMIAIGTAFFVAVTVRGLADSLPVSSDPQIFTAATWTIVIVVALALGLSFTRLRELEQHGASELGFAGLYLLFTSVGAQADLGAIFEAPQFMVAGIVMMSVHIIVLLAGAYILRAPFFFVATGSMANIGGAVSTPIAAASYSPSLAPVGALMGIAGYVIGIYIPLGIAWILAAISGV